MKEDRKAGRRAFCLSFQRHAYLLFAGVILMVMGYGCKSTPGTGAPPPPQELPVITISEMPATTYREYSVSLEGSRDVEIRPQVEGYLDRIYIDEGEYVKKGQPLFHINDRPYREELNAAKAALSAARAGLATAKINLSRSNVLVKNKVVSDVQLKTSQAAYDAAAADVEQAESAVQSARISMGYTTVIAPGDGYIGRIPFKTGSLVGIGTPQPLTVLSEVKEVYAYFSLSENDFLEFKSEFPGNTIAEKIKQMPRVELVLADGSIYPKKGRVETVSGQFDENTGAISFRAAFENTGGLLRSGSTGKVRIPRSSASLIVPQEATFELQDKIFVFVLADSNKVQSTPITVEGRSGNYYLVEKGVREGQKIVYSGIDRLQDGVIIQPKPMSMDSLLKTNPLSNNLRQLD